MSRQLTVLLTSAGVATALNVMHALAASEIFAVRCVVADRQEPVAAGLLAQAFHRLPPTDDPGYVDRLAAICRAEGVSFLFPLHSSEISLVAAHREALGAQGIRTLLPRPEAAALCHDKQAFGAFLAEHRFPHPANHAPDAAAALPASAFPLFLKPRRGSSSSKTLRVADQEELAFHLRRNPGHLIQEFVPGKEYTVDCLRHQGVVYAMVPRRRDLVKDGKSMIGHTVEHPALVALCQRLLAALDLDGPCNVQVIEEPDGNLRVIEVNPRLAAGGLPLAVRAGANIPEMMLGLALGLPVSPVLDYRRGLYMLRYLTETYALAGEEGFVPYGRDAGTAGNR